MAAALRKNNQRPLLVFSDGKNSSLPADLSHYTSRTIPQVPHIHCIAMLVLHASSTLFVGPTSATMWMPCQWPTWDHAVSALRAMAG